MTIAAAKGLCGDLLDAGIGFTIHPNPSLANDWLVDVTVPTGVSADAKQVAALETKWGVSCPVSTISFT